MFRFITPLENNANLFADFFFAAPTRAESGLHHELEEALLEGDLRLAS